MIGETSGQERGARPLRSWFERYLQDKGKGRGGEGGNYRRNAARELERDADHLWRVLSELPIPTEPLTDYRQTASVEFDTEPMARLYIYQMIYDLAQSEVADRLHNRPSLLKGLGLDQPPSQQNISYAWGQFSHLTKTALEAAAKGVATVARDHDVISETVIPIELDKDQDDTEDDENPAVRRFGRNPAGSWVLREGGAS